MYLLQNCHSGSHIDTLILSIRDSIFIVTKVITITKIHVSQYNSGMD